MKPTKCSVPDNVWFWIGDIAHRNVRRKWFESGEEWVVWKDTDHYHVRPRYRKLGVTYEADNV